MAHSLNSNFKSTDLLNFSSLEYVRGNLDVAIRYISSNQNIVESSLIFLSTIEDLQAAITKKISACVLGPKLSQQAFIETIGEEILVFKTKNIANAMAEVLPLCDKKQLRIDKGISERAAIHSSAKLGRNVTIGHFVVIGENAIIGDDTILSHHVIIEKGAKVGSTCVLHPQVVIGADCVIGNRVEIHAHTTIGSDGFGLASLTNHTHKKIPQLGIVTIEDDVEIGANCAIDRATLDETRICAGTKMDNLIHIAHNCQIGPNSRIAAGFFMAGSSRIGANFLVGGSTLVADHVTICDNVVIAGRSGVTKDIAEAGAYGGYPLERLQDAMKTIASIPSLTKLRKQIVEIRKLLNLTDK